MFCAFINVKYNIWAGEQQGQWRYSQISVPVINLGLIMVWNNKGSLSGLINVRSFIRVGSKARFCELEKEMIVEKRIWENQGFIENLTLKTTGRKVLQLSRITPTGWTVICGLPRGDFFWGEGGGCTHSGYHKTLSPTIEWHRISCESET